MEHPLDGLGMGDDFSNQNIVPDYTHQAGDTFGSVDQAIRKVGRKLLNPMKKKTKAANVKALSGKSIKTVTATLAAQASAKAQAKKPLSIVKRVTAAMVAKASGNAGQAAQPSQAVNPQTSVAVAPKSNESTVVSVSETVALAPTVVPQSGAIIEHPLAYMISRPLSGFEGHDVYARPSKSHHMAGVDFGYGDNGELGSILSDLKSGFKTALSTGTKNLTTAAKTGVTTLVSTGSLSQAKQATTSTAKAGLSQAVSAGVAKTTSGAAVQQTMKDAAAITAYEQGKAAAAKGGALVKETLDKAKTFIVDNKKMIMMVVAGAAALYLFSKMKKKARTA